jgi:hypothetical protein|tara:strand:- start:312 stop:596 length:285 start_codon:yes stop_codon:yes gene_type:complete
MSRPIERPDTEELPLLDRFELVKTAIVMIDEGVDSFYLDMAHELGQDELTDEQFETVEEMRTDAYGSLLRTMTTSKQDAKELVGLLALEVSGDD